MPQERKDIGTYRKTLTSATKRCKLSLGSIYSQKFLGGNLCKSYAVYVENLSLNLSTKHYVEMNVMENSLHEVNENVLKLRVYNVGNISH